MSVNMSLKNLAKSSPESTPLVLKIPKTYGAVLPYYQFIKSQVMAASSQTLNRSESMASLCFRSLSSFILEDNLAGLQGFLENKQVLVDDRDENGATALMLAATRGRVSIVRTLVTHGADVNAADLDSWSALLCATREGHADVVATLLDSGAELEQRDLGGWTALMWASYKGHSDTALLLLERGADVNAHGNFHISSLLWAAGRGHERIVTELVARQAKVNVGDKYGTTALVWAARKGYTQIVATLLRAGANVDTQGMYSWTALLVATQGNHTDVVNLLLEYRPNVNALDKDGCTALTLACKEGYYDIAQSLLAAGAYINIQDRMGDTNLIHAVKGGHRGIVEALLKKYADVDVCGKDRKTAMYTAVEKGNIQIVKLLLGANPDLEVSTKDGDTALLRAVRSRHADVVQLLLDKRAKVNATDRKGDTVLHVAMRARSKAIVEILLRNPKNSQLLYRPNKQGETAYNIDLNHQKQILGQVFGARRLNTNEDNENMLGYDLYSSALADMLSEPSLSMPITVGLYAKWGSGKSFLLNKLREEMKNFARQWVDPVFHFSALLFLILVHFAVTVGTLVGVATLSWLLGTIAGATLFLVCYLFLAIVWFLNQRYDWDWPYNFTVNLSRKLDSLKLILQVTFCHPPAVNSSENVTAQPIRFYFTDQTRVSSTTGGENTVVQMLGSLYDAIETNYGAFPTRLYRAFRPKAAKSSSSWRLRRLCCLPYVVVFELCFACLLVGICTLTVYLTRLTSATSATTSSSTEEVTLHVVLITVALLLGVTCVANLYTWGRVLAALVFSQRTQLRRAIARLDTLKSEGFQQALAAEVALMRDMVRCLDALSAQQTRLVVIVDGLDSCEQDKVLLVLDAVHMLFSDANSPFIVILAIDPHVISKAVETNSRRLFNESNISGHDYLRNLVHLPFFLQNSGLRKVKVAQQTAQAQHRKQVAGGWNDADDNIGFVAGGGSNVLVRSLSNRRLSTESALMSSCEKLKPPTTAAQRKGSRKLKLSDSIASSIGSNLNVVVGAHDLTKMLLTDDYFSDVNPRSMRRLMNVVYVTGRLLKAFQVEFNWYHLASWVNITEQWPHRTSWLVLHYERHEDHLDDATSLKTLYDQVRPHIPTLKEAEPLLELDRDEKKFDIFLTFHRSSLLVSDLKIFLPFTINLDPYIKKIIKEEYQQQQPAVQQLDASKARGRTWGGAAQQPPPAEWQVGRPMFGAWGPAAWPPQPQSYQMAPVTALPPEVLEVKLSALNVSGVCQLFDKIDELSSSAQSQYTALIRSHNINGRVLLHCDLDELKTVLRMSFGDWEMFRVLIVSLREHELTSFVRHDEAAAAAPPRGVRFSDSAAAGPPRERKSSNPKTESTMRDEPKPRGPNKQSIMEKQVTLEEQMICGALQTLNEEACEDVLELEESPPPPLPPSEAVPHTTLIPPSPEPQQETEFVVLAGWKGGRWAPVGSGGPSEASSTCSTPRAVRRHYIHTDTDTNQHSSVISIDLKPMESNPGRNAEVHSAMYGQNSKHNAVSKPGLRPRPSSLLVEPAQGAAPSISTRSKSVDGNNRSVEKLEKSPASSLEKLAKLKEKLIQASGDKTQLPTTLDSDDESTPLVSDLSTPSVSLGPTSPAGAHRFVNSAFSPQSHSNSNKSSPSQQFSSPEAEHKNDITDSTDFSPVSPLQVQLHGAGGLSASLLSMDNISVGSDGRKRSGSNASSLSRQNALDREERL